MWCREEAEAQLAELELLNSMYPNPCELQVEQLAYEELRAYVEKTSDHLPHTRPHLSITVSLDTSQLDFTLSCSFPLDYPKVLPDVAVRCAGLSRAQHTRLISDLNTYLKETSGGGACVLSAVDWLKEHAGGYLTENPATVEPPREPMFSRVWIWSHHIYNKTKRKNLLDWSRELELSGFCMPGKPGLVCVEGLQPNVQEFWSRVKVLNWKKILIRHREDVPLQNPAEPQNRFSSFQELSFLPHGNRGNHMDLGLLYQYLNQHHCHHIFQIIFGVEGR